MNKQMVFDFVSHRPYGLDVDVSLVNEAKIERFVPQLFAEAVVKEAMIEHAKNSGRVTYAELVKLRQMLYSPQLTLVSIEGEV
jgi:hypothetical protein